MTLRAPLGLVVAAALAVVGCGSQTLSAAQLHAAAERACAVTGRRLSRIPPPRTPSGGRTFLSRGVAALQPEVVALRRLSPPPQLAHAYARARTAAQQELSALQSSVKGLETGNDPVVAIKTLQHELRPLERHSRAAWRAVGVPRCAGS